MKKLFSFFIVLSFVNLLAQPSTYRIKLNTYQYKNNAIQAVKQTQFNTYVLRSAKYYNHYTGSFKDKRAAMLHLEEVRKKFKSAYIVRTISKTATHRPIQKKYKPRAIKTVIKKNQLQLGKSLYNAGNYDGAFAIFDKLLINEPNNQLARLEYARTLYVLGFYTRSKVEFQTVLATNPPQTVQNNINAYLEKIKSKSQKNSFYGSVGIAINYDDNLGYNTDDETTMYAGLELQNDTNKSKGFYETIDLSLAYLYIGDSFNWNNRLYTYHEFQNEEIDNLSFFNFITSPSKNFEKFKISFPISVNTALLAGKAYSYAYLLNPTLNFIPNKTTNFTLALKHQKSNIADSLTRDYTTNGIRVSILKTFDALTLFSSGTFEQDRSEKQGRYDISRDKTLLSANIYYQLFKNSLLGIGYGYNLENYTEIDAGFGFAREDKKSNYSAFIKQKLSKNGSTTISYQRVDNSSNINTYSYKKNSYTMSYNHNF